MRFSKQSQANRRDGRRRGSLHDLADAVWMALASDRLLQVATGIAASLVAFLFIPILPMDQRQAVVGWLGPAIFALLIPYAFLHGEHTMGRAAEDAFWRDLVLAAWSTLAAVVLRRVAVALEWDPATVLSRLCLVVAYTLIVIAVERQPHREALDSRKTELRLTLPTILLLVVGLLIYFVLLPALLSEGSALDLARMSQILTALGLVLAIRVIFLAVTTDSPRWRALYGTLALLAIAVAVTHGRGLPAVVETLGPSGWPRSLLWLPPMMLAVLLARIRHHPFPADRRQDVDMVTRLGDQPAGLAMRTMFVALAVPVVHFGAYRIGLFDPAYEYARESWVFFWIVGLGAVAVFQNRRLSERLSGAFRERRRIENALANTERSLRLADTRRKSEEAVWNKKEKYVKAFRYSPDAMLLTNVEEGRLLEFNNRLLEILGYSRDQVTGKTVFEIDLWADHADRDRMVESLRRDGFVRNIDVRVRTCTGAERMVYLSAELMEITGQSCIFAVARDVTAREENLSALQHQATLLDLACEPIVVIDRDDLVTYGNDAASRLLGLPAQEMRGQPLAEVLATPNPAEVGAASRATREHGVWHGTLKAGTATGGELHLDAVWSLVTDGEGDATAKLIFLR